MNGVAGHARTGGPGSPVLLRGAAIDVTPGLVETFRAMACDITLRAVGPSVGTRAALAEAQVVFHAVERACTRFDPASPLMRANAEPDAWHEVPTELYDALVEAYAAHRLTEGLFDPRVLRTLEAFGYDRSLPFAAGDVATEQRALELPPAGHATAWEPEFDETRQSVRLGPEPVDLGGIGKGLAVRWAAERLAGQARSFLVEAGGDCYLGGTGPEGSGWRIGVEDPLGGAEPVAVLQLSDVACATSSIRLRQWRSGDRRVHHIIDPRTGAPGGGGLMSVTVVGPDPAVAEVWSKSLFLCGLDRIARQAQAHKVAAVWLDQDGQMGASTTIDPLVIWRADDVG
jgi:thiamine biosynthesis lipoprotein